MVKCHFITTDLPVVTPGVKQNHGLPLYGALWEGNLKTIDDTARFQQPSEEYLSKSVLTKINSVPVHLTDDPHGVLCRHLVKHVGKVDDVK